MDHTCDLCDKPLPPEDRIVSRRPRPSDPSEMVAIMWACEECTPIAPGCSMKEDDWDIWVESPEARKMGVAFLD